MVRIDSVTQFSGYEHLERQSKVVALFIDGQPVDVISAGANAIVVRDDTQFYGESGGQDGDKGELKTASGAFIVSDTQKYGKAIGHQGTLSAGKLSIGDGVEAVVDVARRERIRLNHSATHLLHAALRQVLGKQ
ncbi:hypothetical protein AXF24_12640 [Streptococcus pneumoniae]|nr:hypothetical protein AWW74_12655 [Streptococcus pneumoniae]KXB94711.1 hypothetical protein AXF24_12640 [Streptococcus pneumoniae]